MTVSGSNKTPQWRQRLGGVAVAIFIAALTVLLTVPTQMKIGTTTIRTRSRLLKPLDQFYDGPSGFVHETWDGPTGEFTYGDNYGIKIGRWLFRLDIDRVWPHQVQPSGALDP
jgi:hypothetical protein